MGCLGGDDDFLIWEGSTRMERKGGTKVFRKGTMGRLGN